MLFGEPDPTGGTKELFGRAPVPVDPVPTAPSIELLDVPLVPVPEGWGPWGVVPAPRVARKPLQPAAARERRSTTW